GVSGLLSLPYHGDLPVPSPPRLAGADGTLRSRRIRGSEPRGTGVGSCQPARASPSPVSQAGPPPASAPQPKEAAPQPSPATAAPGNPDRQVPAWPSPERQIPPHPGPR